jgi:hypothetical protein
MAVTNPRGEPFGSQSSLGLQSWPLVILILGLVAVALAF